MAYSFLALRLKNYNFFYTHIILYLQYNVKKKYDCTRTHFFSLLISLCVWRAVVRISLCHKSKFCHATEGYPISNSLIPKFFWKKIGSPEWGETIFWLKNGVIGSRKLGRGNIARKIIIGKTKKHHLTKKESIFQFLEIRSWSET